MSKSRNSQPPLTELVDADIRRIDAVKGPANGNRFLIAKSEEPGMVSDELVRTLIAQPEGDQYTGAAGEVIKAEEAPVAPVKKAKEPRMATKTAPAEKTPAVVVGDVKKAKAVLKQAAKDRKTAALVKRAKKIEKKALLAQVNALGIAKGTLGSLSDAHAALLDATDNLADQTGVEHPALPVAVAGVVGKLHGVDRPHLHAHALQRKHRGGIADMAIGNVGLDREQVHGVDNNRHGGETPRRVAVFRIPSAAGTYFIPIFLLAASTYLLV